MKNINLPPEILNIPRFVMWRLGKINPKTGRKRKIPCNAQGKPCNALDPINHLPYKQAIKELNTSNFDGIGIALNGDGLCCLDIDNASQLEKHELASILNSFSKTWTEQSQSGDGYHVWFYGNPTKIPENRANYQLYKNNQFIALTAIQKGESNQIINIDFDTSFPLKLRGNNMDNESIQNTTNNESTLSNDDILSIAFKAKNGHGNKTRELYNSSSNSEDDYALTLRLAPYTHSPLGSGNHQLINILKNAPCYESMLKRHPKTNDYLTRTINKAVDNKGFTYTLNTQIETTKTAPSTKPTNYKSGYHLTDMGNAERFAYMHGRNVRYCYPWKCWLVWTGEYWEKDNTGLAEQLAKKTTRSIYHEAGDEPDSNKRSELVKHAKKTEAAKNISSMLQLARSEKGISIKPDQLDNNHYYLNVKNGVINLKNGILQPHKQEDYQTKILETKYNKQAQCPIWLSFLNDIMQGDKELVTYLQRSVGYSLTSNTSEQCLFFLYGHGKNGKTTFIETISSLIDEYGLKTPTDTLMAKKSGGGGIPNDVARLNGVRMVTASEINDGNRLNESLVKDLTGGDTITARFLRAEFFDFKPVFKLWMFGNHKPIIRGTDKGIWRRIRLIPFKTQIKDKDIDKNLPEKLKNEMQGILAWAVQGCIDWQNNGLNTPTSITSATKEYQAEMDITGAFINDCCTLGNDQKVSAKDIYDAYKEWAKDNGEFTATQRRFGTGLSERGFERTRQKQGIWWRGISLINDFTDIDTGGGCEL